MRGSAALPRLLLPRLADLRLRPWLWLMLVGAPACIQHTAHMLRQLSNMLHTGRAQGAGVVSNAVACAETQIGRHAACCTRAGTDCRGMLTKWCRHVSHPEGTSLTADEGSTPLAACTRAAVVRKVPA